MQELRNVTEKPQKPVLPRFFAVFVVALLLPAAAAQAQDSGAAAPAGAAAVQCYNESLGTVQETLADDCKGRIVSAEEAERLRKKRRNYIRKALTSPSSKVPGKRLTGLGSGFFVAADGSVVTSRHVIDDCAAVSISPTFGEMEMASHIASAADTDLALLRADIRPPAVAPFTGSANAALLGSAFVVGYPNRGLVTVEPVLSTVEVLASEQETDRGPAIVVRGDIRQGNSGGPLLDSGGGVLGVVFAKINSVNVYKNTGQLIRDIGLAVPGEILTRFLKSNGVELKVSSPRPPQPAERILSDARPFLVQVGCWN